MFKAAILDVDGTLGHWSISVAAAPEKALHAGIAIDNTAR